LNQIKARPPALESITAHGACRAVMKAGAPTPAIAPAAAVFAGANAPACAGLRRDLLHHWQRGFPIEHSPFQAVARRAGGSLREVLGHCQALAGAGALDVIRVRRSPRLARVRWRCGQVRRGAALPAIDATLRELPGVARLTLIEAPASGASDVPWLWFDIAAGEADRA
jgi:hypothetical protein